MRGQPLENFDRLRMFQVKSDAAFVAMQVLKVGTIARTNFGRFLRRLDLDHFRAPVSQLTHGGRAGAGAGKVDHLEPCKR